MNWIKQKVSWLCLLAATAICGDSTYGGDTDNLTVMLDVAELPSDPKQIDWKSLPKLKAEQSVVFRGLENEAAFNLHAYMARHDGKLWAVWSCGKVHEDKTGQHIRFATSSDGLSWSEPQTLAAPPAGKFRCISRGFWQRDGELLAMFSIDEEGKYFGESLRLMASRWNSESKSWEEPRLVYDNAISNFPPEKLPDGQWMMTRRNRKMEKSMLIGGVKGVDQWQAVPIAVPADKARLEEPVWWTLPDNRVVGLFRDNSGSKRLYRAISTDSGRTWTTPVRTNFPDATAKFNSLRLKDGRYLLASNPNPAGRIPLCISLSDDGLVFRSLAVLRDEPTQARYRGHAKSRGYHYPHLLDDGEFVYVVYAENKEDIVISKLRADELTAALRAQGSNH